MKKFFTLIAALMMLSASAETLSLYNYESETYFAPINSMWFDTPGNQTQVLYPAADLTDMVGKEITAITFYTDEDGVKMNGGTLELYMGETEASVVTDYVGGLTLVGTVELTASAETELTLTFDTPYLYQGGNLVFGNVVKTAGNMTMTYFGGQEVNYNNCIYYGAGGKQFKQFLPQTTFTYGGGETPQPQSLRGDVNMDQAVSILDVTALIDYLLTEDPTGIDLVAADCNLDEGVSILDVTALIDYLLTETWSTAE